MRVRNPYRPPSIDAVILVALWHRATIVMLLGLVKPIGTSRLPLGFRPCYDKEPSPSHQKTHAAQWRDRPQPAQVRQRQQIQATAKQHNAAQKTHHYAHGDAWLGCQSQEHEGVERVIHDSFFPDFKRLVRL